MQLGAPREVDGLEETVQLECTGLTATEAHTVLTLALWLSCDQLTSSVSSKTQTDKGSSSSATTSLIPEVTVSPRALRPPSGPYAYGAFIAYMHMRSTSLHSLLEPAHTKHAIPLHHYRNRHNSTLQRPRRHLLYMSPFSHLRIDNAENYLTSIIHPHSNHCCCFSFQFNMLRTNLGPSPSATHTTSANANANSTSASNTLDSLTIPIVFGAIGAVLTLATIVIGIIQIRAARCRHRDAEAGPSDHELDEQQPRRDIAGNMMPPPQP
jgi:hypothetical protein